tara:strand:+ start:8316 stop:8612 length:297 start_codon:yes stop_codon:yes gene_type:complete
MIKLDFYKIGMWGVRVSVFVFCVSLFMMYFVLPGMGERALYYLLPIGLAGVAAKFVFIGSSVLVAIGYMSNKAAEKKKMVERIEILEQEKRVTRPIIE